jgi:hypothetical protein
MLLAAAASAAALAERGESGVSRAKGGHHAEAEGRETRERRGDGEHAQIQTGLGRDRQCRRHQRGEQRHGQDGDEETHRAAQERQYHTLRDQLTRQALPAGAERRTHRQLALVRGRARQQQVCEKDST